MSGLPFYLFGRQYMRGLDPGMSAGQQYKPPPPPVDPYGQDIGAGPVPFDEAEARKRAQRAGASALFGGLLDSYLSGGQNLGRAFEGQRAAFGQSMDSAEQDAKLAQAEYRQRKLDAAAEAERRARIDNLATDNQRLAGEAKDRAAERAAAIATKTAEAAQVEAQRKRLIKDNPAATDYSPDQVTSEYGKRYGYHEPDKPQEISPGAYLRDPRTGAILYHAPERTTTDKPPTPSELRAQRSEEQRQLKAREDELVGEWKGQQNPHRPISSVLEERARTAARQQAKEEFGIAGPATAPEPVNPFIGAKATTGGGQAKPSRYDEQIAALRKNQGAPAPAASAPQAAGAPAATDRLNAVSDAAMKAKIAVARRHGYSDNAIVSFLGL